MTVTWRNTQSASTASGTTITVTKPTGTVDGDLLILLIRQTTETNHPPQGLKDWIEIPNTFCYVNDNLSVYYRYASSEPADYTFTAIQTMAYGASITAFYSSTGGNVALDTWAAQVNTSSTNRTFPSITLSATGMAACFGISTSSSTAPGSMTERLDASDMYVMTGPFSAGATGTLVATGTANVSNCVTIGLIEGPAKVLYGLRCVSYTYLAASSGAGTKTVTVPPGVVDGDLMVMSIAFTVDATPTVTGWTAITNGSNTSGGNTIRTYYRIASSEPANYTITWTGTQTVTIAIMLFRGLRGWPLSFIVAANSTNTTVSTHSYPAITPTTVNQMLLLLASYSNNIAPTSIHPLGKKYGGQVGTTVLSAFIENQLTTASTTGKTSTSSSASTTKVISALFAELEPTPNTPTGLTVTAVGQNQIDLLWSISDPYATTISIERSADGSTGWTEIATQAIGDTTYSNTGLTTGTIYYYRVRALVETVYGAYSSIDSDTTFPGLLAPTGLVADAYHPRRILIVFTDPNVDSTGNLLERSPNGSTGWTEIADLLHGVNEFDDNTRTPSTTYYYRVRSYKVP